MEQTTGLPLKSAYLVLQAPSAIDDCAPLLNQSNTLLTYVMNDGEPISSQIDSIQRQRRMANTTRRQLQMRLQRLQYLYDEWTTIVRSLGPKHSQELIKAELSAFESTTISPDGLQATINRVQGAIDNSSLRLPQLELPTFDGNPCEWFGFWDLFAVTVDRQPGLSDVEKLAYLLGCLRGKAKSVASGYHCDANSYAAVVKALQLQFGDVEALGRHLHNELRRLRSPLHRGPDLHRFHNDVVRLLHQMRLASIDPDHPNVLFSLEERLTEQTRLMLRTEREKHPENTAENFCKSLLTVTRLLDNVQTTTDVQTSPWDEHFISQREHIHSFRGERNMQFQKRDISSRVNTDFSTRQPSTRRTSAIAGTVGNRPLNDWQTRNHEQSLRRRLNPCVFCSGQHFNRDCTQYKTVVERRTRATQLGLCFRCLKKDHISSACSDPRTCKICKGPHHSLLCTTGSRRDHAHAVRISVNNDDHQAYDQISGSTHADANEQGTNHKISLLLWQTARVYNPLLPQTIRTTKTFLDQGSQTSFISEKLATQLGLERRKCGPLIIHGVGDTDGNTFTSAKVKLGIRLTNGSQHIIEARTLPRITQPFPHASITERDLSTLTLPDQYELPVPIYRDTPDLLIGSDFMPQVNPCLIRHLDSGFTLYDSGFGPLIGGCGYVSTFPQPQPPLHTAVALAGSMQFQLEDLWSLDVLGIKTQDESIEDDERALAAFSSSIQRLPCGRYSVSWPWKTGKPHLCTNFGLCVGRLNSLLRQLASKPELRRLYQENLRQQMESGIIEQAPITPTGPLIHHISHQPVWNKEKKKLRVVYDASASAPRGQALNDNLLRGPVFLPDLVGQLLRLRSATIAIVADVEKAFLQVQLNETDRDVTRFLWVDNPDLSIGPMNPITAYRFKRVFFGAISSPFLLAATIQHHLRSSNSKWAPHILENTYVDNVLLTCQSTDEAMEASKEAKRLFAEAHMNLRDFQCNDTEVNAAIAPEDRHDDTQIKVLGIPWNTTEDTLTVDTKPAPVGPISKRSLLQFIAKHFDPLGYLAPVILPLKILLQNITKENLDWDTEISPERQEEWRLIRSSWKVIPFVIPRQTPQQSLELHTFVDASVRAYAAVVYLRSDSKVTLLYAKSQLCPIKGLTVPRLELLAATIGTRVTNFVATQLHLQGIQRTIWSDSKCVLAWINAPAKDKFPRFVKNRLNEINQQGDITFAYVPTKVNPADIATRGLTPSELVTEPKWWHGPRWLSHNKDDWPQTPTPLQLLQTDTTEENPVDTSSASALSQESNEAPFSFIDVTRFRNWSKLIESTALALRFMGKLRNPNPAWLKSISTSGPLLVTDRHLAFRILIRQAQSGLVTSQDILKWDLQKDQQGLWRCGGRLTKTLIPRSEQYPIFLPRKSKVTRLIIIQEHRALLHGGATATLTRLRQKFWIPQGRRTVKIAIGSDCLSCRRWNAKPFALPAMPTLPAMRVQPSPAFNCTAIDLLGPILIRGEPKTQKRWLTLFTCLVTRAVHLEVTRDLSALNFIETFRRFIARRGIPEQVLSDNGTNLVMTAKALKSLPETSMISWTFITPMAPWKGGIYERIIGMTKTCLKHAIGRRLLTDPELHTLAIEVEAILNERPLTYVESDDLTILRPIDYLQPRAHLTVQIDGSDTADPSFQTRPPSTRAQLIEQWSRAQSCRDNFWKIWHHQYLHLLRERTQRFHRGPHAQTRRTPHVGEVVLVHDENAPRGTWKLARIESLSRNTDNVIRTARIRTGNRRVLTRTIAQLYPLEIEDETTTPSQHVGSTNPSESTHPTTLTHTESEAPNAEVAAPAINTTIRRRKHMIPFFILSLTSILLSSCNVIATKAQICPYRHVGAYMRFPEIRDCTKEVIRSYKSRTVAVYSKKPITINASYCSNIERTICTWAFMRWILQVTNDTTTINPISVAICLALHRNKTHANEVLVQQSNSSRWATNHAVSFSFGLFGTRCQTTSNYIIEEGFITFLDGHRPLSSFTRTKGCIPKFGRCYTQHETVIWNYDNFAQECHYRFIGVYSARVSDRQILIDKIQASLIRTHNQTKEIKQCNIRDPVFMENNFVLSFHVGEGSSRKNRERNYSHSFLEEETGEQQDPENPRLQYLYDIQSVQNAQKWCEVRNMFIQILQWISISDATAAVRLLLGRNDIAAHNGENYVMITKCLPAVVTKEYTNHKVEDQCYEKLPVVIGNSLAFVESVTHDVVMESRQIRCPWMEHQKDSDILSSNFLSHLIRDEQSILFNSTRLPDLTTEMIEIALDRLDHSQFINSLNLSRILRHEEENAIEEFIHELGHEVGLTTKGVVNALEAIATKWKTITILIITVPVLLIALWAIRILGCLNICRRKSSTNDLVIHIKEINENMESEKPTKGQPIMDTGPKQAHQTEDNIESHYSPPILPYLFYSNQ